MKIIKSIQNSLLLLFIVLYQCSLFHNSAAAFSAEIAGTITSQNQELTTVPIKPDEVVIYKKDIVVSSDELKKQTTDAEEFKTIEKHPGNKQEILNLEMVNNYVKEGRKFEARNVLSDIFINKKIPEKQKEIKDILDKLNEELIFSPALYPDATFYTVQSGDVLAKIAKKFNTNYELIMRINGKSTPRLSVGEKLKILTGKTKILVNKSDFTLTLVHNDHYLRQYRICIGKDNKTPEGTFEVKNKMKEPTWYSPQGGVFPYGHKENILGTRWIGFKDKPNLVGFGIHGTTLPESIGTASSNGCVRMVNSDVEELYDFVTLDTEIIIQG